MFNAKKNQVFESKMTNNRIRVREVQSNSYDNRYSVVKVVNINNQGRAVPQTERSIYMDSVRRRYETA